jgi:hypothetical protein
VQLGRITPVTAAALVFAGLLSVLLFPVVALALLRTEEPARPGEGSTERPQHRQLHKSTATL